MRCCERIWIITHENVVKWRTYKCRSWECDTHGVSQVLCCARRGIIEHSVESTGDPLVPLQVGRKPCGGSRIPHEDCGAIGPVVRGGRRYWIKPNAVESSYVETDQSRNSCESGLQLGNAWRCVIRVKSSSEANRSWGFECGSANA